MPRQYSSGFRDEMVRRMLTGEPVLTICSDTGVPEQTLHRWEHQALIDAGLVDGIDLECVNVSGQTRVDFFGFQAAIGVV
jgi:transposase-like protein